MTIDKKLLNFSRQYICQKTYQSTDNVLNTHTHAHTNKQEAKIYLDLDKNKKVMITIMIDQTHTSLTDK